MFMGWENLVEGNNHEFFIKFSQNTLNLLLPCSWNRLDEKLDLQALEVFLQPLLHIFHKQQVVFYNPCHKTVYHLSCKIHQLVWFHKHYTPPNWPKETSNFLVEFIECNENVWKALKIT